MAPLSSWHDLGVVVSLDLTSQVMIMAVYHTGQQSEQRSKKGLCIISILLPGTQLARLGSHATECGSQGHCSPDRDAGRLKQLVEFWETRLSCIDNNAQQQLQNFHSELKPLPVTECYVYRLMLSLESERAQGGHPHLIHSSRPVVEDEVSGTRLGMLLAGSSAALLPSPH